MGISKEEFLYIIQNIEDQNIFILNNIESVEGELDDFKQKSKDRYQKDQKLVDQLKKNNANYDRILNEKRSKQIALEKQTNTIKNAPGFKISLEEKPKPTLESSPERQSKMGSPTKQDDDSQQQLDDTADISQETTRSTQAALFEAEQIRTLKHMISSLYAKLKADRFGGTLTSQQSGATLAV